jgi:hypothetical protein
LLALLSLLAALPFASATDDGPFIDPNGRTSSIDGGGAMDPNGGTLNTERNCYSACVDPNG